MGRSSHFHSNHQHDCGYCVTGSNIGHARTMNRLIPMTKSETCLHRMPRRRCGTTLVEVLVSFSLLATMVTLLTSTAVHHSRLRQSLRHERLAMDELSNQLELLSVLPDAELSAAVAQLQPGDVVQASLPGVELKADIEESDGGTRMTLQIAWDSFGRRANPLRLTAWRFPSADKSTTDDSAPTAPSVRAENQAARKPTSTQGGFAIVVREGEAPVLKLHVAEFVRIRRSLAGGPSDKASEFSRIRLRTNETVQLQRAPAGQEFAPTLARQEPRPPGFAPHSEEAILK